MSDEKQVTVTMGVGDLSILVNALQNEQARCAVSKVLQKYAHRVNAVANHFSKLYDAELHAITCENIKALQ